MKPVSTPEPQATRDRILDAAEALFSERGFHGASVRDIFKHAGLGTGLMAYYFSSKEDLFRETVERRIPEVRQQFEDQFPQVRTSTAMPPCELWEFYLRFFLVSLPSPENPIKCYWDLLSKSAVSYDLEIVRSSFSKLDFIAERMMAALGQDYAGVPQQRLRDMLSFAEAAVTTLNSSHGLFEHRQGANGDIDAFIKSTAHTLAAGLISG